MIFMQHVLSGAELNEFPIQRKSAVVQTQQKTLVEGLAQER